MARKKKPDLKKPQFQGNPRGLFVQDPDGTLFVLTKRSKRRKPTHEEQLRFQALEAQRVPQTRSPE